jgi:hypothetical protein
MTLWGYLAISGIALACCALVGAYAYVQGYRYGLAEGEKREAACYNCGFAEGKRSEADFWIGTEKQVDQEQTRMWREDAGWRGLP